MTGRFEYGSTISYLDQITIDNIGECCLEANNDLGEFYYLWITTSFGQTKIYEYGPYLDGIAPDFATIMFMQFQYSEPKIEKRISKFISSHDITQVREIDADDVYSNFINFVEFMKE